MGPFLMMKTQFQEAKFALEEALKGQGQEQEFTQEVISAHKGLQILPAHQNT